MANTKSTTSTKKIAQLKEGDRFIHTTKKGKQITVTAVAVRDKVASRGTPASKVKDAVAIKTKVKSGPNAGKDRIIVEYEFSGGSRNYRYADLTEEVTLAK